MAAIYESDEIRKLGDLWAKRKLEGASQPELDDIHDRAEKLRNAKGYSGCKDGSQTNPVPPNSNQSNLTGVKQTSNPIKTNTSYNGGYLTIDLNTDYTAAAKKAAESGDYSSAAKYEAMRNAKVNYLNSIGQNPNNYQITSDYIKDYGYKNNEGGQIFDSKFNSVSELADNWVSATINGAKYTRDANGRIYNGGLFVGDRINQTTGEFAYSNTNDAKKAALDRYISVVNSPDRDTLSGLSGENAYNYAVRKGLLSDGFVDAVQNGTVGDYIAQLEMNAPKPVEKSVPVVNYDSFENGSKKNSIINISDATPEQQHVIQDNSFEPNVFVPSREEAKNDYILKKLGFNIPTRFY